jgi:hypothetical protein
LASEYVELTAISGGVFRLKELQTFGLDTWKNRVFVISISLILCVALAFIDGAAMFDIAGLAVSGRVIKVGSIATIVFFACAGFRQIQVEVSSDARTLTKSWHLFSIQLFRSVLKVRDGDSVEIFTSWGPHGGDWYHSLMIVRGRRRFMTVFTVSPKTSAISRLEQIGREIADVLHIVYQGYSTKRRFFWW